MKPIPLKTKFNYFASKQGEIFKELANGKRIKLKGWIHIDTIYVKRYARYGLYMKNGKRIFFYGQRLVAMAYHNLLENENRIVRHLTTDSLNNRPDAIIPGTHSENQTIDRILQGTYMNRGVQAPTTPDIDYDSIDVGF